MSFSLTQLEKLAKNGNSSAKQALNAYKKTKEKESVLTKTITKKPESKVPILVSQLKQAGITGLRWSEHPKGEYKFHHTRRWRLDVYDPGTKVALEVEGGIHSHGKQGNISRHLHHSGYEGDIIKYFNAEKMGIWVLRASSEMVKSGIAASMFIQALELRGYINSKPNSSYIAYREMV
jgi:hypothetical protein